jgi:hypothetical protein
VGWTFAGRCSADRAATFTSVQLRSDESRTTVNLGAHPFQVCTPLLPASLYLSYDAYFARPVYPVGS